MIKEHSYGIVPLRRQENKWYVLLIKHRTGGHWTFPKGHSEGEETPQQSANRELFEETNLNVVRYLSDSVFKIRYRFFSRGKQVDKVVWFYPAEVCGEVKLQEEEVVDSVWKLVTEAGNFLTYDTDKTTCQKVCELLSSEVS